MMSNAYRKYCGLLITFALFYSSFANAQGDCSPTTGACSGGYQYPSGTFSSNTNSWGVVSTTNWAGEYGVYSVTAGNTYEWSLCSSDGGSVTYDAQLTLKNNSTLVNLCYSDDYCETNKPKIQWTATFTGTVRVLISQYNCTTNSTNTQLVWRCSSCGSGSAPANDNCAGAVTLTPGSSCSYTTGNVSGATQSVTAELCSGYTGDANDDVWYKFTATSSLHTITVAGSASFDPVVDVRSGACNGTSIACADLTSSGGTEVLNLTGLTPSSVYYVRVYDYGSGMPATTSFSICVTTPSSCNPGYSTGTTYGDFINRVQLGTIDNTPAGTGSAGGPSYVDYYSTINTSLQAGTAQTLTVTVGTYGGQTVAAWIDYNSDGDFADAGEKLGEVTNISASSSGMISFTIPAATSTGAKRMRVRDVWSTTSLDPCTTYSYGEAEDYKVTITAACTTPGTPVSLNTTGISVSGAQLNWSAGTPAGSATVTYYWALGTSAGVTYESGYLQRGTTTGLNSGALSGLNPGTTYYWTVKAYTSCDGTVSSYASAVNFTTSCTTPSAPTALNTANISTTSADLRWTASASGSPTISYYWAVGAASNVTYEANYLQRGIASTNSVTVFGLTANTGYYWTVKAVTSCNGSASSYPAAINFTTTSVPTPLVTWNGNTSTSWFTNTNWTPNVVPAYTDNVIIPSGRPNYPNITTTNLYINPAADQAPSAQCKSLIIDVGGTVTVNGAGLYIYAYGNIDISGTLNHQSGGASDERFRIYSTSVVTVKNGGYLNVGSSSISGGMPGGTINSVNDLFVTNGQLVVDPGGTVFIQDALRAVTSGVIIQKGGLVSVAMSGAGSAASDKVSISGTSTFRMLSGTMRISGDGDGSTTSWDAMFFATGATVDIQGGTIELLNGTASTDFSLSLQQPTTLNNLIINKASKSVIVDGYDFTLDGDLTISNGTLNANGYNITAAGNFSNSGTFTAGSGAVTFTGASKTIGGNAATTFNTVTFNSGSSYTLNSSAAVPQATFNGTFTLNSNSSLALASGNVINLAGASDVINGTLSAADVLDGTRDIGMNNAAGQLSGTGSINADLQISSGTTTLMNNFTLNGDFFLNTGAFVMSSHTFNVNGGWTSNSAGGGLTAGTGSVILGGASRNISGTTNCSFNNLTLSASATYTLNPSDRIKVNGTYYSMAGSSLHIASGSILDLYGSTVTFDGTTTASGANNTSIPGSGNGREIDINNTATLSGSGTTGGDMRIYGGTTTLASNFTLNGNFEIRSGATFTMTTHQFNVGGSWTNSNVFNAGTGTVRFTGTASSIVDAGGYYNGTDNTSADFYNVIVDRSADTISMKNTPMKVKHDYTLTNGIFSTGWKTNSNGTGGQNRRLTVEGFATIGAGTTFFVGYRRACNNSSEALSSFPSCGSCTTCNPDSLNVPVFKGNFFNYGSVRTNRPVVSAYMDVKLAGARIAGTGVANEFGVDFQVETNMTATQVGPVDIQGDLIIQDNTGFINTDPNNVLTVRGNFYMYYDLTHNGTVNCYRDFTSGSTTYYTPNTVSVSNSIFNFYQTGALRHIFLKASASNPIFNFGEVNIIAGAGNVRELRQRISVSGNLNIQSGTLEAINSGTTSSGGSISPAVGVNNASIVLQGSTSSWTNDGTFTPHSDTVTFSGSSTQGMGGVNSTTFYNLTVNKGSSSELQFGNSGYVNNNLTLTAGYVLTTPSKLLTLNNGSYITYPATPAGSFVRGPMKKIGCTNATEFIFPVGKASRSARISYAPTSTSATNEFTAEYFYNPYTSLTPVNSPLNNVSGIEYWQLDRGGASPADAAVKLYWEDAASSGISSCAAGGDLVVARWNGSAWEDRTNSGGITGSCSGSSAGTVKSNTVTSFSPFTFSSKSGANPLPVELLTFDARLNGEFVDILWSTASEFNTDNYSVERSVDMDHFQSIGIVNAAGNSTSVQHYKKTDTEPLEGTSYYRLKITDLDGSFRYSQAVPVTIKHAIIAGIENDILVYPNPSSDGMFNIGFTSKTDQNLRIMVLDLSGRPVHRSAYTAVEGEHLMQLDLQDLSSGLYFLTIQSGNQNVSEKLIISR